MFLVYCVFWGLSIALFIPLAEFFEKCGEHPAAFFFQDAPGYFDLMVKLGHFQNIEDGTAASGLGIHAAHNHFGDACLDDGAGAHLARLQRDIKGTAFQTPVPYFFAGFIDGCNFGMGKGVFIGIAAVIPPADNFPFIDNYATDRDFP